VSSSRVPARGEQLGASRVRSFSSKVPAYEVVRCQRTEPGGGYRTDCELASHKRLTGHSKGFWGDSETEWDRDVTNRSFPHERYKPSRTEALLRPRVRTPYRRPLTKREAFRPLKMLSEVQSKCGLRGRTELHELVSTMNANKNPKEGRHACLSRGGKMA